MAPVIGWVCHKKSVRHRAIMAGDFQKVNNRTAAVRLYANTPLVVVTKRHSY